MMARLRVAQLHGHELRTSAIVIAQVWRSPAGKQAGVAKLLRSVNVRPVDEKMGRDAGALLAKARTDDPIDATVVLIARSGDRILTSDPEDIDRLAWSSGKKLIIVPC
jgi:predicted nucleic acid-binding protein